MAFGDADASSPSFVAVSSGSVATTATFTPPNGAVLQVVDYHDTASGNTTNTSAITDSLGLTWTQWAVRAKPDSGAQNARVAVWTAVATGAAMTVTTTGTNCAGACGLSVRVVSGADTTTPVDVVAEGSSTGAAISLGITTVTSGARAFLAATDWNVAANMTAGAGQTAVRSQGVGSGPDIRIYLGVQNAVTSPAALVTMSTATPTASNTNNFIAWALHPSGSPTPISVGDTGSAAEALSAAATAPLADTAGSTQTLTANAATSSGDAGSAAGTLTANATAPLTDAGTADQSLAVTVAVPTADSGSGTETLTVGVSVPLADTGTATPSITVTAAVPVADTASGADALTAAATAQLADVGTAAEALTSNATASPADTATATDTLVAGIAIGLADTGSAVDAVTVDRAATLTDAGTATQALTVDAVALLVDTGTAGDALTVAVASPLPDAAGSTDALTVTVAAQVTDLGSTVDALAHSVAATLADLGSAADILTRAVLAVLADGGAAADALTASGAPAGPAVPAAYARSHVTGPRSRTGVARAYTHPTGRSS